MKRSTGILRSAWGYLYLLMTGLSRLPAVVGVVFRGISKEKAPAALKKLRRGYTSHWSGFSSASTFKQVALDFARDGGCVLRVQLQEGHPSQARDIRELSPYIDEGEILLLPNFRTIVTNATVEMGVNFIDLMELPPVGNAVVDY